MTREEYEKSLNYVVNGEQQSCEDKGMTREEALTLWLPVIKMGVKDMSECNEALDMAINALEQKSEQSRIDLPESATNGDVIKAMFPDVEITELFGIYDEDRLYGYSTWFGGQPQDFFLDWWNAPYKEEGK